MRADPVDPEPYPSTVHTREQMQAYLRSPVAARCSPATVRAAWWTWWSLRRVVSRLRSHGVAATVPRPPRLPAGARRGVEAVLRRTSPTCLERCLVLQAWLASQGVPCEVVVGVRGSARSVAAHAWLDVESSHDGLGEHREIHRLGPR